MSKFKMMTALSLCLSAATLASAFAVDPIATHDGRYIETRTAWAHWTPEEQKEVIDVYMQKLDNQIAQLNKANTISTFSNSVMTAQTMDDLTGKLQYSMTRDDNFKLKDLLPTGFMIYIGASGGGGLGVMLGAGVDIGLVVVPQMVTRKDTLNIEPTVTEYRTSWTFVAIEHGHLGVGGGVSANFTLGGAVLFGDLNDAHEFRGPVGGVGLDLKFLWGADFEGRVVYNSSVKKVFGMAGVAVDFGAEAEASADGEGGRIVGLGDYLAQQGMAPDQAAKLSGELDQKEQDAAKSSDSDENKSDNSKPGAAIKPNGNL